MALVRAHPIGLLAIFQFFFPRQTASFNLPFFLLFWLVAIHSVKPGAFYLLPFSDRFLAFSLGTILFPACSKAFRFNFSPMDPFLCGRPCSGIAGNCAG
jgi:hypothetical protein